MPRISCELERFTPHQMLFARCYDCGFCVNWVHDPLDDDRLYGTCCGLVYDGVRSFSSRLVFVVRTAPMDATNVVPHRFRSQL